MNNKKFYWFLLGCVQSCAIVILFALNITNNETSSASGGTMAFFKKKAITYDVKGINVRITSYQPTVEQCDSSPFITASGDSITEESYYTWCAVSKDLLNNEVNFGDSIYVDISDAMTPAFHIAMIWEGYDDRISEHHGCNCSFEEDKDDTIAFIVKDIVSGCKHIDILSPVRVQWDAMLQGKGKIIGIKRKK